MGRGDATVGEVATAGAESRYCMRNWGVVGWAIILEGPSLDGGWFNLQSLVPSKFEKQNLPLVCLCITDKHVVVACFICTC